MAASGDYYIFGFGTKFWSCTEDTENTSNASNLNIGYGNISVDNFGKGFAYSVRCVKE
jgi:uncharacterized protein (TIGR02145 family)